MNFKSIVRSVALALIMAGCATPKNSSLITTPAYNALQQHATARIEAMSETMERVKLYSFLDIDATKEKPADLENLYAELRASYLLGGIHELLNPLSIAAEYNGGTGIQDTIRFGPIVAKQLWDGNFISVKLFPVEATGKIGMQAGLFISQDIGERVNVSLLGEYNFKPNALYGEAEASVKLKDRISAMGQLRTFVPFKSPEEREIVPIVGLRYKF